MNRARRRHDDWDNQEADVADEEYYEDEQDDYGLAPYREQGLAPASTAPSSMPSLVGVSATVTNYGAPLLSYTKTMSRFYQTRRQVLSVGRLKCEICGERIGGWAWTGPDGQGYAHDGCYDRLAWAWASLYAEQQAMASRGELE
jgi:hypothetical protein